MNRDIDRRVAEALGWTRLREEPTGLYGCPPGSNESFTRPVPRYDHPLDSNAAIGALEKFARGLFWEVKYLPDGYYWCMIYDPTQHYGYTKCSTLTAAICAAILAANEQGEKP